MDETRYPLTLFDALKVILFSEIFMVLFEVEICLFPTFQETIGATLTVRFLSQYIYPISSLV